MLNLLLTSLGEEGAEALVGLGRFALGSQVTIGLSTGQTRGDQGGVEETNLDTVLKTVELLGDQHWNSKKASRGQNKPPSMSWQSGSQPGRL